MNEPANERECPLTQDQMFAICKYLWFRPEAADLFVPNVNPNHPDRKVPLYTRSEGDFLALDSYFGLHIPMLWSNSSWSMLFQKKHGMFWVARGRFRLYIESSRLEYRPYSVGRDVISCPVLTCDECGTGVRRLFLDWAETCALQDVKEELFTMLQNEKLRQLGIR